MQPNKRRREPRRSSQGSSQRGAIAVMAAVAIAFICFPMVGLVAMTGFLWNAHQQLTNYADSVSAAWGLQMAQMARGDWQTQYFNGQMLAQGHGYTSNLPTAYAPTFVAVSDNSPDYQDRYTAAYARVNTEAPYSLTSLTQAFFPGFTHDTLFMNSRVRVNQVTLLRHTLYRQPVMLMLDFSSTMRLPYTGKNGTSGETASEALKRVAKRLIDDSSYVYNLGIMGFSDGVEDMGQADGPSTGSTTSNVNQAWDEEKRRRDNMASDVGAWVANGDGTNIQRAVEAAGSLISDALPTGFPLQKPLMIIVTDGEPNLSTNARKGSGQSLQQLQQIAAVDARNAMNTQRGARKDGVPAGVDALVLQIQREQADSTQGVALKEADEAFLRNDLAGPSNRQGDPNWFHQDGGDPNELSRYMQAMPKYPFCEFTYPLDKIPGYQTNNVGGPVPNRDVISAFVAFDDQYNQSSEVAIDSNNIFTDRDKFLTWASDPAHAAYLTAGSDPRGQTITTGPLGKDNLTGNDVLLKRPQQFLGMWFNPSNKKIYVSGMLCAALNLPTPGSNQTIRLRIRWGYPQLAADKDFVKLGP